jgi:UDP-N-acetylmuramate-alanine ligase
MNNTLAKTIFRINKPSAIIICGRSCFSAGKVIREVIGKKFKVKKMEKGSFPILWGPSEVLIYENPLTENIEYPEVDFLLKNSSVLILATTNFGEIPAEKDYFESQEKDIEAVKRIIQGLNEKSHLVLNFDDGAIRRLKGGTKANVLSFGFGEGADFRASDVNVGESGTNFKINHSGSIVPLWIDKRFGKEQIYSAVSAACVGYVKGLNLVQISQALKDSQK